MESPESPPCVHTNVDLDIYSIYVQLILGVCRHSQYVRSCRDKFSPLFEVYCV